MLTPAQLLTGYARGVFPMAESADDDRLWLVDSRCGSCQWGVHVARSLRRDRGVVDGPHI